MSSGPKTITWNADPHTIAKIEIVRKYLYRWALITGTTFGNQPLTYIDGFAGPGEYTNYNEGSPLAAVAALNEAKKDAGTRWKASRLRALFVEQDVARKSHLENLLKERGVGDVGCLVLNSTFVDGLAYAQGAFAKAFFTPAPLVVFIDPFGATGFPWDAVVRILSSKTSEIILNFDADGIGRILAAGQDANADEILTTIFGGDD
jgi:three-Cys-motif partner protein